jgi:uncharacterized protein
MTDTDQREAIEFLAKPASYGEGVEATERIDTHASIVFLAGGAAYKLKRAVAFGYLDFTTRARRRLACTAELKVNRRFAPHLYRRVRTIRRRDDGTLAFDGPGRAIDWVVEMRRFDPAQQLDVLADRHQLSRTLMLNLATRLASLHDHAEIAAGDQLPTLPMRALLTGIEYELDRCSPILDRNAIHHWSELTRAALGRLEPLLMARRDTGKVRWCHGDLHLANWCLLEGEPTPFDALEFSRALATTDILYDLAFPLMDLAHRGQIGEANALFNRYFDLEDEIGGLAALPLFQSLRAAIRSHVLAAAAAAQPNQAQRDRLACSARAYFATALEFHRRHAPRLIAIGGFSGTGKSTLAYEIAPCLGLSPGARVLRSDVVRKRLHNVDRHHRLPAAAYDEANDREVYRRLSEAAATALAAGCTAVVDAVFARATDRVALRDVATKAGVPFTGLWLEAPAATLRTRLQQRAPGTSDSDLDVLEHQLENGHGRLDWHRIDTLTDMASCRHIALRTAEFHHAA